MTTVASFTITHSRFLDPAGALTQALPEFARGPSALKRLYRAMALTRVFDARALALQRTGRLGTYASSLGQEAVAVGLADAMRAEDVLVPSFREHGAQLLRGVTATELFLYWGGDERGSNFASAREDFPVAIPVGSQAPHAAGVALAFMLRGDQRVAVCAFGDGATSKGDVYEAMNLAGVWRLPVVFVINNNQWSISVPRSAQTAAATLAQKAVAAGFAGEQVDGNDVIAVRHAVGSAIERARGGEGPALIEAITYRLADHTTADDARRYRDDAEVSRHWKDDPIARLRLYLTREAGWTKDDEEHLLSECGQVIVNAAETYLAMAPQPPSALFDHLHASLPDALAAQRDILLRESDRHG